MNVNSGSGDDSEGDERTDESSPKDINERHREEKVGKETRKAKLRHMERNMQQSKRMI
jgi:hypothetical protein